MELKLEFYVDEAGEHRWRVTHTNGNIVAASTEGYVNAADALANAKLVLREDLVIE